MKVVIKMMMASKADQENCKDGCEDKRMTAGEKVTGSADWNRREAEGSLMRYNASHFGE